MEEDASNCQVVQVQPLAFSEIKLITIAIFLLTIGGLSAQIHLLLAITLPLYLLSVLYYLYCHNYSSSTWLLFKKVTWDDNFKYVSVKTHAFVGSRANSNKLLMAKALAGLEGDILIQVKQSWYRCRANSIRKANQGDLLRLLGVSQLDEYSTKGLSAEILVKSTELFGMEPNIFEPKILKVALRYLSQQIVWVFLCIVSLITATTIYLKTNNIYQFLLHLCLDSFLFIVILIQSHIKLKDFRRLYSWLGEKSYKVIRQEREIQVKLSQLLVGDVVCLSWEQAEEDMLVYFQGILVGKAALTVRDIEGKNEVFKFPLKDASIIGEPSRQLMHVLFQGTRISKQQKDLSMKIVVTERSLGKYFSLWLQKSMNQQFDSVGQSLTEKALWLLLAGSGALVAYYILLSLCFSKTIWPIHGLQQAAALLCIVSPLIFLLNQVILLIVNLRLNFQGVYVFQSQLERLAFCSKLYIEIKELLELQFAGLLQKNQILTNNYQQQEFIPSQDAISLAGSNPQPIIALIIYISLGKFDDSLTCLKQLYEKYKEYYEYDDQQDKTIISLASSPKRWTIQEKYPPNEKGMRSWLIQYDRRDPYLITEINQINEAIFNILSTTKQDNKKRQTYVSVSSLLLEEGRQLKGMFFRYLKDQVSRLRHQSSQAQLIQQPRQKLQNFYEFSSFIVFDNALPQHNSVAINQLREIVDKEGKPLMKITFLTKAGNKEVQGFEHINKHLTIHPNCSLEFKALKIKKSMSAKGTILIGHALLDVSLQSLADFSIQIRADKLTMLLPCDISIKSATQLSLLLQNSRWILESLVQTTKLAFIITIFQLFGLIYKKMAFNNDENTRSIVFNVVTLFTFLVVPTIIKQLLSPRPTYRNHLKIIAIFTPNFLILCVLASLSWLGFILLVEKSVICGSEVENKGSNGQKCAHLDILIGSWVGVLQFCVFYSESSWLTAEDWGRILLLPIWLAFVIINNIEWKIWLGMSLIVMVVLAIKKCVRMQKQPA